MLADLLSRYTIVNNVVSLDENIPCYVNTSIALFSVHRTQAEGKCSNFVPPYQEPVGDLGVLKRISMDLATGPSPTKDSAGTPCDIYYARRSDIASVGLQRLIRTYAPFS
jgi:hypothetical protein